jgi:hypothetical protein
MDQVHKHSGSKRYTPWSEPFTLYMKGFSLDHYVPDIYCAVMSIKRSIVPDFIGFKLNTRNILSTLAIKF